MSSEEIKTIYMKLVQNYTDRSPSGDPLWVLNKHVSAYMRSEWKDAKESAILDLALREGIEIPQVQELIEKGRTRKEAILEVSKTMKLRVSEMEVKGWIQRRIERRKDEPVKAEKQRLEQQIKDLEKTIERLTALFSKGELNEESYTTAVKKIEKDIEDLRSGKEVFVTEKKKVTIEIPKTYHPSYEYAYTKPTRLWYLVPLFFGLIGGLIAYVGVKDEDPDMASALIWLGLIVTAFGLVMLFVFIPALLY